MKDLKVKTILFLLVALASSCAQRQSASPPETTGSPSKPSSVRVSPENTDAAEPAIATAADGTTYVVWVEHRSEGAADVFLKKFNADGGDAGALVRVNPNEGTATAWRGDPPTVAVDSEGRVYVGWTARAASAGHANNLSLSVSADGGLSFAAPVKVNDDSKPASHGMHSLTVGKDGRVYLAWLDERNIKPSAPMEKHRGDAAKMESNSEVFTAYSVDGGRTFSGNLLIAKEACPCCKTAIETGPDGRVYIGWRQVLPGDFRHIAVAASTDNGKTFSDRVIVSNDQWVIAACPVSGPALSTENDGTLDVLWYTAGEAGARGLYLAQSKDGGRTFTARQPVADGAVRGNPFIQTRADGNGSQAIWQSDEGGTARLMRANIGTDGSVSDVKRALEAGELPAAAHTGDTILVAYISKVNDKRSVWLARFKDESASRQTPAQANRQPVIKHFSGVGVITGINMEMGSVELDHEEIKDLMPAMRMEYYVKDKALLNGLKVGDRVNFTVEEKDRAELISAISKNRR